MKPPIRKEKAATRAGGMPDIPLVLFSIDNDGCVAGLQGKLAEAFREATCRDGVVFHGSGRRILVAWATPSMFAGNFRALALEKIGGDAQVFGYRSEGLPEGTPDGFDFHPLGIALRIGGETVRISGAAGVACMPALCRSLGGAGMKSEDLEEHFKRLMKKNLSGRLPGLDYRRAEQEMTNL
jgi:hypothetical protein